MRKTRIKSSVLLALILLLVGGQIAAQTLNRPAPDGLDGAMQLSLEDALRMGLEASPEMKQAQLSVQLAELIKDVYEANELAVARVDLEAARQAYEDAVYQAQLQQVKTALEVERLYYDVLRAQDTLALREDALQRAEQQYDVALSRFQVGAINQLQLREVEQEVSRAQHAEEAARSALALAELLLKQEIGLAIDVEIQLIEEASFQRQTVDLATAVATAEQRRYEIYKATQDVALAVDAVQRASAPNTPKIELERAQIGLMQAETALEIAYNTVRPSVWKAVFALEAAERAYDLAREDEQIALENYQWVEEQHYVYGQVSLLELLNQQAKLASAQVASVAAMYDYNIAWAEYLSAIGMGFDRWPGLVEDGTVIDTAGLATAKTEAK